MKSDLPELFEARDPDQQQFHFIEFLTNDLNDTSEHLRETDRKLALAVQGYTGVFVLSATLILGLIDTDIFEIELILDWPGFFAFSVIALATWWLYSYALKSKIIKQDYIQRMNFLRREIHFFLGSMHSDLPGYWTAEEIEKHKTNIDPDPKDDKRHKVGLDDLYPLALKVIMSLLVFPIVYSFFNVFFGAIKGNNLVSFFSNGQPTYQVWLAISMSAVVIFIVQILLNRQMKNADLVINKHTLNYKKDSKQKFENNNVISK